MPTRKRARKVPVERFYVLDTANETVLATANNEADALKEANYMADNDQWDGSTQDLILAKKVCQLYVEITPKVVKGQ